MLQCDMKLLQLLFITELSAITIIISNRGSQELSGILDVNQVKITMYIYAMHIFHIYELVRFVFKKI